MPYTFGRQGVLLPEGSNPFKCDMPVAYRCHQFKDWWPPLADGLIFSPAKGIISHMEATVCHISGPVLCRKGAEYEF
jgi:hypothetical protein